MDHSLLAFDLGQTLFGDHPDFQPYATNPYGFISRILPNIFIIAGLILFTYFIAGGFVMIAAGGNPKNMDQGKGMITNAIIGFIVIFASYWIIQIIQIITGIPILNPTL